MSVFSSAGPSDCNRLSSTSGRRHLQASQCGFLEACALPPGKSQEASLRKRHLQLEPVAITAAGLKWFARIQPHKCMFTAFFSLLGFHVFTSFFLYIHFTSSRETTGIFACLLCHKHFALDNKKNPPKLLLWKYIRLLAYSRPIYIHSLISWLILAFWLALTGWLVSVVAPSAICVNVWLMQSMQRPVPCLLRSLCKRQYV